LTGSLAVLAFALMLNPPSWFAFDASTAAARFQAEDAAPSGSELSWTFDDAAEGALPESAELLSQPAVGGWAIRAEADTPSQPNALCQTGTAEFPAIALNPAVHTDAVLTTRFKPISGAVDQAAGLLFRIQDADNYYILRANALENNVNFYRYVGGRRSLIKEGSAVVASGQWQELRAEITGTQFRGFLNGQLVVEATDDTYTSGRPGLWTKADSVTCFDDVQVTIL
jgi:hypothetical protein